MLLFDIIRDWFVQYIWGGVLSDGETTFSCCIGMLNNDSINPDVAFTDSTYISIGHGINGSSDSFYDYIALGDWLSTTSTIIVLVLMCVFLFLCVRYLFKVGAGLFSNLRG